MSPTITDDARRCLVLFEDETGASVRDCVLDDEYDRVLIVVEPGEMATAVGPGGQHVHRVEEKLGQDVKLIEGADTPEAFVANALAPAVVHNVTVSDGDETVAYAEVDSADRGAAIGKGGENVEAARRLAKRRHGIDVLELA